MALQRTNTSAPNTQLLDRDAWRARLEHYRAVTILPAYGCIHDPTATADAVSIEIQFLASERALSIDGTYSTRTTRKCTVEKAQWPTLQPEPGTLYILLPEAATLVEQFRGGGATCEPFDYGFLCSRA